MLVFKIREACDGMGWQFNYGRDHWQNLLDLPDDSDNDFIKRRKHFLLLYQNKSLFFDSFAKVSKIVYDAQAIFAVRSRINDKDYNEKYEDHLEKLWDESYLFVQLFPSCDGWALTRWEAVEVENTFDTNLDGILVKFGMEYSGFIE